MCIEYYIFGAVKMVNSYTFDHLETDFWKPDYFRRVITKRYGNGPITDVITPISVKGGDVTALVSLFLSKRTILMIEMTVTSDTKDRKRLGNKRIDFLTNQLYSLPQFYVLDTTEQRKAVDEIKGIDGELVKCLRE